MISRTSWAGLEAIRETYDSISSRYDQLHEDPVTRRRFRVIEAPLARVAARSRRLLELGCGTGRFLARAPATGQRFGIDVSAGMLARARRRHLWVTAADAHRLPFADATFDGIVAPKGVFRYLNAPSAFAECRRVLAPAGLLGVHQYGARPWSPRRPLRVAAADSPLHLRRVEELLDPATAAGLRPVHVRCFRSTRWYPYALPVPATWPGDGLGTAWNHVVAVFRRPPG